jgi:uncharacterized membrane protein
MPVWLIPIVCTLLSLVSALALPRIEHTMDLPIDIGISAASALAVQSAIASEMMALTGIVFATFS